MRTRHILLTAAVLFVAAVAWMRILSPSNVQIDSQFALMFLVGLVAFVSAFRRLRD